MKQAVLMFLIVLCAAAPDADAQRAEPIRDGLASRDTPAQDTIRPKREKGRFKKNWNMPYPSPTKAGVYSLIFPGAGQIYNKRYWKAPLVWAAVGGVVYAAVWNGDRYRRLDIAYGLRVQSEQEATTPTDEFVNIFRNSDAIKARRDQYDRTRQTAIIGVVAVYALNALEAYVDAHLKNFDIDDDLSFGPVLSQSGTQGAYLGIGIGLRL